MMAPREVSTTDRPSAWGRIRVARVSSWSAAPAASARSARPRVSLAGLSPALCSTTSPPKYASLPISVRSSDRGTTCASMPTPRIASTAPSKRGRVRGRRGEHEVAGALELGVDRGRAQALDVLEGLDRLAVERLGALDAVEPPQRGQRLLEPRVAEAAVAGRGAPADPLGLEQDDARAQLGRATGRRQAHEAPAHDHDVDRVREVAAAPVGRVGHRCLPERARVHVPQLGDRGHRVRG